MRFNPSLLNSCHLTDTKYTIDEDLYQDLPYYIEMDLETPILADLMIPVISTLARKSNVSCDCECGTRLPCDCRAQESRESRAEAARYVCYL